MESEPLQNNEKVQMRIHMYWFIFFTVLLALGGIIGFTALLLYHNQATLLREFGLAIVAGFGGTSSFGIGYFLGRRSRQT